MEPLTRITAATVDVLISLIGGGETGIWGLAIVRQSSRLPGTVYPILERLERAGWVRSEWESDTERTGPRRRLYELTEGGLGAARATISSFAERSKASPARPGVAVPFGASA